MKAKEGVVDRLNGLLTADLTAVNQYFLHAEMARNWGYERLYSKLRDLSMGEMRDSEALVRHILFLEGLPNLQRLGNINVGESVHENLRLSLQSEQEAVETLTEAVAHCNQVQDYATTEMLEEMLRDEEVHVDWLETQLESIAQVGLENYLSQQLHD